MRLHSLSALALLLAAAACGDDTTVDGSGGSAAGSGGSDGTGGEASTPAATTSTGATTATTSASSSSGGEGGGATTGAGGGGGSAACGEPGPADRDRFVVVGHKFTAPGTDWEVLRLTAAGVLELTGNHFTMGESTDARIAFTPDGRIGIAVQEQGTLGVFTLDEDGVATVVDAAFGGGDDFYAQWVAMAPDGGHVIVGDGNTTENGGGLYRLDLDCETGELTFVGLVADVNNAWAGADLGGGRWAVGSNGGALGVEDGNDIQDLREGDPWTLADAVETNVDGATFYAVTAARDGSFLLAADNGLFAEKEVTLVTIEADGFTASDAVPLESPFDIAIAPEGDVALVADLEGDALQVLDVDLDAEPTVELRGELEYEGDGTLLPGKLAIVERGPLDGAVLVAELYGVRLVTFDGGGVVTDHGLTITGEDIDSSETPVGIGIQP